MSDFHPSLAITAEQAGNLRKLAAYLLTLPPEYPDFAMRKFSEDGRGYGESEAHLPVCGTAACAAGHGPMAGIPPLKGETWFAYSERAFAPSNSEVLLDPWEWCFSAIWADVDNTAHGAAQRILWMLENGVPENAVEQMLGDAPLIYAAPVPA